MISARFNGTQGSCGETAGILEEVWDSGACLHLEARLEPGSRVQFKPLWRGAVKEMEGVVRSCHYEAEFGNLMEIDFLDGYRWNPRLFRPRHLLDPDVLKARPAKTRAAAAGAGVYGMPPRQSVARADCNHP
jgi:hypothetical protein